MIHPMLKIRMTQDIFVFFTNFGKGNHISTMHLSLHVNFLICVLKYVVEIKGFQNRHVGMYMGA